MLIWVSMSGCNFSAESILTGAEIMGESPTNRCGLYIVFSGIDGSGKSTQAAMLQKRLSDLGYCAVLTEGVDHFSFAAMQLIAAQKGIPYFRDYFGNEQAELLLAFESLRDHVIQVKPLICGGAIVISPRSPWDRVAKARMFRCKNLSLIKSVADRCERPDLHIFLDITIAEAMKRIELRNTDSEDEMVLQRLAEEYENLAAIDGWVNIDSQRPLADVATAVWRAVEPLINGRTSLMQVEGFRMTPSADAITRPV
jgi:dTMP kinase